jgi:hypothetical protein
MLQKSGLEISGIWVSLFSAYVKILTMEIKNKLKPLLPHFTALILFTIISFAYFYPVLEGKVLKANDSMVSRISSKEIMDYREKTGNEALWTNSMFSGMPAYLISTKYPGNLFKKLDTILRVFKMPVSVLFISMAGFYILLLMFGLNPWLSLIASIAYGLSSFLFQILAAGHNTQAIALAYAAPMIGSVYYAYRHNAIKGALLTALFLTLELLANHPQITYYAMICILVFVITEFIFSVKEKAILKFVKTSLILLVPLILAIGINFGFLFTTYEYGKYSVRGKSDLTGENKNASSGLDRDYITYWSYGINETMNLLIPNFKGGSSSPFDRDSETVKALRQNNAASAAGQFSKYWGPQQGGTAGPHYVGAIVLFLFVLGLIIVKGREKWWLLIATLLSIMLAWGKNFMPFTNLFIDFFPGYSKFRAVTMTLVISQFCIPLLGALALRDIFNSAVPKKALLNGLKLAAAITGGVILLVIIIPGLAGSFLSQYETEAGLPLWLQSALIADRKEMLKIDGIRSLVFILLSAAALFGFIFEKLRKEYAFLILGLLIVADLWSADKRYLNAGQFEKPSVIQKTLAPSVADEFILKDKSYYRVLNLSVSVFNDNSPTSYFHKSIGGYHGAKLKRYQEFIDTCIYPALSGFGKAAENAKSLEEYQSVLNNNPVHVLNMLNARYVILDAGAPPIINQNAFGNAWFVEKPIMADNANMEISLINKIDPSGEAVIDKKFKELVPAASYPKSDGENIELTSYQPNELIYKYSARSAKLAVFSEIYYPAGWKCFIDGKESSYFRADYVLRAMVVPEGEHEIKFIFEPSSYIIGEKVSMGSSLLLILLIAGYFGYTLMKK